MRAAGFARLRGAARSVIAAGAGWIGVDVMGNHCVPKLSIGPAAAQAIRLLVRADGCQAGLVLIPTTRLIFGGLDHEAAIDAMHAELAHPAPR